MIEYTSNSGQDYHREIRADYLAEFATSPSDEDLWWEVYGWVRLEEEEGLVDPNTTAASIPAEELIGFAEQVRAADPADRYQLTTTSASDGQRWFDVLRTFSSEQLKRAELAVLQRAVGDAGIRFQHGLDIGTGTGKSLPILEGVAEQVLGVDRDANMLRVAAEVKSHKTTLVQADVEALPFQDESFGIISSSGVEGALDKTAATKFYSEIGRLLVPGGIYIDSSYYNNEDGYVGDELDSITDSWKATLADMIVDTVSGKLVIEEHLEREEQVELLSRLELYETYLPIKDEAADSAAVSAVRIITKRPLEPRA